MALALTRQPGTASRRRSDEVRPSGMIRHCSPTTRLVQTRDGDVALTVMPHVFSTDSPVPDVRVVREREMR